MRLLLSMYVQFGFYILQFHHNESYVWSRAVKGIPIYLFIFSKIRLRMICAWQLSAKLTGGVWPQNNVVWFGWALVPVSETTRFVMVWRLVKELHRGAEYLPLIGQYSHLVRDSWNQNGEREGKRNTYTSIYPLIVAHVQITVSVILYVTNNW